MQRKHLNVLGGVVVLVSVMLMLVAIAHLLQIALLQGLTDMVPDVFQIETGIQVTVVILIVLHQDTTEILQEGELLQGTEGAEAEVQVIALLTIEIGEETGV